MKITALMLATFLLSGCAYTNAAKTFIDIQGARIADDTFKIAEFTYCRVPTIGAIMREFRDKPKKFAMYLGICSPHWNVK